MPPPASPLPGPPTTSSAKLLSVYPGADTIKKETISSSIYLPPDPQVPPYKSAQFVKALTEQHKVFYYFTYPNELHGFSQRDHRLDAWRKELAFLQKYVQPKYGLSSTSTDALLLNGPTRVTGDGQTRRTSASDER